MKRTVIREDWLDLAGTPEAAAILGYIIFLTDLANDWDSIDPYHRFDPTEGWNTVTPKMIREDILLKLSEDDDDIIMLLRHLENLGYIESRKHPTKEGRVQYRANFDKIDRDAEEMGYTGAASTPEGTY